MLGIMPVEHPLQSHYIVVSSSGQFVIISIKYYYILLFKRYGKYFEISVLLPLYKDNEQTLLHYCYIVDIFSSYYLFIVDILSVQC